MKKLESICIGCCMTLPVKSLTSHFVQSCSRDLTVFIFTSDNNLTKSYFQLTFQSRSSLRNDRRDIEVSECASGTGSSKFDYRQVTTVSSLGVLVRVCMMQCVTVAG